MRHCHFLKWTCDIRTPVKGPIHKGRASNVRQQGTNLPGSIPCICEMRHVFFFSFIKWNQHTTYIIVVIWDNIFQTELMVEIYSEGPVSAIGKVLLMKFS